MLEDGSAAGAGPAPDLARRFISWFQRMDAAISKDPQAHFAALPDGAEVKALVVEIAELAAGPTNEQTALEMAKNIFTKLYQGPGSRMHLTSYAAALEVRDTNLNGQIPPCLCQRDAQPHSVR